VVTERERLIRLAEADAAVRGLVLERCRRDVVFWMDHFCWTVDPRKSPSVLPMVLYPYQRWVAEELVRAIEDQDDIGIEKSRDMGLSYLAMYVLQWFWLFHPGSNFHVGSRRADEVDRGYIDPAETLFGKFRFNLERLPVWMLPAGFSLKKHSRLLSLENPALGNFLTGESANAAFGRGGRKRAVLMDEFAFWEHAEAAYTAASQTSGCRIIVSTPYGEGNAFYALMHRKDGVETLAFEG
jgi:phage terminase large subunit